MSFIKNNSNINVSSYVAIGDSITAGYTDGALFYEGQQHSFVNFLAQQFKALGCETFNNAYTKPNTNGVGFYGNAKLILEKENTPPRYIAPMGDFLIFTENTFISQGPFHNMSVSGAKAISLLMNGYGNPTNGEGNFNPFFTRMASNPYTASVLTDTLNLNPTFFTVFIGNNDILSYASSGALTDKITPIKGEAGIGFEKSIFLLLNSLTQNGAKGVIANIGEITHVPYFTIIPFDGLILNNEQCIELTEKYKEQNLTFKEGKNPFIILDENETIRFIKQGELIFLEIQLDANRELYLTGLLPIPKKYNLVLSEVESIQKAILEYNLIIKHAAETHKVSLVDVHSFLKVLHTEIKYDVNYRCATYSKHGVFSLDGLHLNAFGQAMLANIFIKAINSFYHTQIELVDAILYKGI